MPFGFFNVCFVRTEQGRGSTKPPTLSSALKSRERPEDAHGIPATWRIISDEAEMHRTPEGFTAPVP